MKFAIASTAVIAAALMGAPAQAKASPEVEIRNAVARVVVIVEDRTDVAVEVTQGNTRLPALQVRRRGDEIQIDGGLGRRVGMTLVNDAIRSCRSGPADARQPGDGAIVEVRDLGRINVSDAPLIVIRSPREVSVSASSAVFGAVGRGARSVELSNGGCGDWVVANTDGALDLSLGGSGDIRTGTSRSLDASLGGSGTIRAGTTGDLDLSLGGSGQAWVAGVDGDVEIAIGGSGEVSIPRGRARTFEVAIGGSGDIDFGGTAGDVSVAIAGSGDIRIAEVTGRVSRSIVGSGNIRIGR
jgi:hypothetical protein